MYLLKGGGQFVLIKIGPNENSFKKLDLHTNYIDIYIYIYICMFICYVLAEFSVGRVSI